MVQNPKSLTNQSAEWFMGKISFSVRKDGSNLLCFLGGQFMEDENQRSEPLINNLLFKNMSNIFLNFQFWNKWKRFVLKEGEEQTLY